MTPVRILIADDHALFRKSMRGLLESVPDMAVAGEAATVEDTVRLAADLLPDVVLMDINLPGSAGQESPVDGLTAIRRMLAQVPVTGIVVLTMFGDDELVFAAMRAGARGYLLKYADQEEVLLAIRAAART